MGLGRASGTRGQGHGWRIQGRGDMGTGTQGCPDQVLQPLLLRDVPLSLQPADVVLLLAGLGGHSVTSHVPKVSPPCPPPPSSPSPLPSDGGAAAVTPPLPPPPHRSQPQTVGSCKGGREGWTQRSHPGFCVPMSSPTPLVHVPICPPAPSALPPLLQLPLLLHVALGGCFLKGEGGRICWWGGVTPLCPPAPSPHLTFLRAAAASSSSSSSTYLLWKKVCVCVGGVSGWAHVPPLPPK